MPTRNFYRSFSLLGHADSPQNCPQLEQLSRDRAHVCLQHLVGNGVAEANLTSEGKGALVPAKTGSSKRVEIHLTNGDAMFEQVVANIERRRKEALRAKAPKVLVYTHVDQAAVVLPDVAAYRRCSTQEALETRTMWLIRPEERLEFKTVTWNLTNKYVRRDANEVAEQAKVASFKADHLDVKVQPKLEAELARIKADTRVGVKYTIEAKGARWPTDHVSYDPLDVTDGYLLTTEVTATAREKTKLHVWASQTKGAVKNKTTSG